MTRFLKPAGTFLLFLGTCVLSFVSYFIGVLIAGIGFIMVFGGFTSEHWPVTILGIPILLAGAWLQFWWPEGGRKRQ